MSRPPACLPSPPALLPPSPFSYRCSLVPLLLLTQSWVVHLSTRPQHPLLGNFPAIRERKMFCRFGGQICLRNLGELCPQSFLGSSQLASGCRKGGGCLSLGSAAGSLCQSGPESPLLCKLPFGPPPLPPSPDVCLWHPLGTHRGSAEQLKLNPIQSCSVIGSWYCLSLFLLYLYPIPSFFKRCHAI